MSTCISRHGEFSSHVTNENLWCDRCAAWDEAAIEHATEEPCDGLRLAALIRELEGLREKWISQAARTVAFDWAASDLAAVLARAAGGTG